MVLIASSNIVDSEASNIVLKESEELEDTCDKLRGSSSKTGKSLNLNFTLNEALQMFSVGIVILASK